MINRSKGTMKNTSFSFAFVKIAQKHTLAGGCPKNALFKLIFVMNFVHNGLS